jgi:hypothetical protein
MYTISKSQLELAGSLWYWASMVVETACVDLSVSTIHIGVTY